MRNETMSRGRILLVGTVCLLTFIIARAGYGCAVCFGDKDSPMTHGMNAGIFVLLGFIGVVLAAFATFFIYLWWRARNPILETLTLEPTK